jgi:uncharacterized membrane-anchored protein
MTPESLNRLREMLLSFAERENYHSAKCRRARKSENFNFHWERAKYYLELRRRVSHLAFFSDGEFIQVNAKYSRWADLWMAKSRWAARLRHKEEGKAKFERTHKYSKWFFSDSLTADYGTFQCERCHNRFYHAPSTILKGAKQIYYCCCGNCTNTIIHADHGINPYE